MELNEQQQKVFLDRYSFKDTNGNPTEQTVEKMWERVAKAISTDRNEFKDFLWLLEDFKFLPGGRILAGAGGNTKLTFYNCFVIPLEPLISKYGIDSRPSIMDTITTITEITSRGGGIGINWSGLRPKNAYIKGVHGKSSGPISWMIGADGIVEQVEQGGSRRGAQMFMLNVWHPDIFDFINIKQNLDIIKCANLSVGISNSFMKAVRAGLNWQLEFPDLNYPEYDTIWNGDLRDWTSKGLNTVLYKEVPARKIWEAICESAWKCGEPGVVFLDRYQEWSNTYYLDKIICTNPCGEQGLPAWGVCNLGSINLTKFISYEKINFKLLEQVIQIAIRFLDNVIDKTSYLNEKIRTKQLQARRIGLGVMGFADMLIMLKIPYGSEEAKKLIETLFSFIRDTAYVTSSDLARLKGIAPELSTKYFKSRFVETLPEPVQLKIQTYGIRNLQILTQAPTGTTSILAGVSSGIEPNFAWEYTRKDRTGEHKVMHPLYGQLVKEIKIPDYFVTASDLTIEQHVETQALIQKFVDSSISKTINAPYEATLKDAIRAFGLAWKLGCKGITYYRDKSREGVLIKDDVKDDIAKRPRIIKGDTISVETPLGRLFLTLNFHNEKPFEIFCQIGKAGSDVIAFTEAIARLVSLGLRSGIDIKLIIHQLENIGGALQEGFGLKKIKSIPDAIAKILLELTNSKTEQNGNKYNLCPECNNFSLIQIEGCNKCAVCGYSSC